jgi:phage-related protein
MVNMLGGGSEALKQLREDAQKTGYVLSEKAARDAEAFADAQLDAQLTIKGLKNTIGAELMPVVTRSMKQFSGWAVSNRDDIKAFAETATEKLETALPVFVEVATGIGKVSSQIGDLIGKTAEFVGGWENLGVIVGGVFASRTIMSVVSFGASVGRLGVSLASLTGVFPFVVGGIKAIGTALMANPIGLAIGAIAGGAYLIYQNWESIGPWFSDLIGGVAETFQSATVSIKSAWESIQTSIGSVVEYLAERFEWLMQKLSPVLDGLSWIRDKGADAVSGVRGIGSGLRDWWSGDSEEDAPAAPGKALAGRGRPKHISGSYLGGDIGKGPRHVGEQGPETIWPSKGLYVAHAGATERLAQLSDKAAPLVGALGSGLKRVMAQAHSTAAPAMVAAQTVATPALQNAPAQMPTAQTQSPIVIHAQIHAAHLDAEQIVEALEARGRAAQAGALFDDVHGYGQYEGA